MLLTGEPIDAARAAQVGLVNTVTDEGGALAAALELASQIAANGPLAVAATKRIAREGSCWPAAEGWIEQATIIRPVMTSADAREGAAAFAEKRPPVWTGR
jgi:enoyl-CoA hydratase